ncbi:hypothetical protein ABBQ38_006148 [Trebouxia sp. C0009 RCD-2024]
MPWAGFGNQGSHEFSKADAPSFWWGAATAAYQIEGAYQEGGRGLSIWDTFSHEQGRTDKGDTGDVAVDFYHRYQEDIQVMKGLGIKAFRMSISWPRIQPTGTGVPNQAGLDFYNAVIDSLLAAGIEPWITLYHWDLPQVLHDRYGGWLSKESVPDFAEYADICFRTFGDRIKHWSTFNEPWTFVEVGYHIGAHAPGHKHPSDYWQVGHHVLLAHAAAVKRFRQTVPDGKIGIVANSDFFEPLTSSAADQAAAQRCLEFMCARFSDPVYFGDYPQAIRDAVPNLPKFTPEQQAALKGSVDFFLINHYSTKYISHKTDTAGETGMNLFDGTQSVSHTERDGKHIGPQADSEWLYAVPWGFRKLLTWIHKRYNGPDIYVLENGVDCPQESSVPIPDVLNDTFRLHYYQQYLAEAVKAVKEDGVLLKGYFAWSLLDNFEWADGYAKRFGIVHVDYSTMQRRPKQSAEWLKDYFAQTHRSLQL